MKKKIGEPGPAPTGPQSDTSKQQANDSQVDKNMQGGDFLKGPGIEVIMHNKLSSLQEEAIRINEKITFINEQAAQLNKLTNISFDCALEVVKSRMEYMLDDRDILFFNDESGRFCYVGEILDAGERHDGSVFLEPLSSVQMKEYQELAEFKESCCFNWSWWQSTISSNQRDSSRTYHFTRIEKKIAKSRFSFISSDELPQSQPDWLIEGHIEAEKSVLFFGVPGSFKSFLVIGMGLSIATGNDWHGFKVKKGSVLYICGEGQSGIKKRIVAWENYHNQNADNFLVSTAPAQIISDKSLAKIEMAASDICKNGLKPELIIIDTLNRNFGDGDENSTPDMTKFIQGIDRLSRNIKCTIFIVHHSGLSDTQRSRGSSVLRGAMDFEYLCKVGKDNLGNKMVILSSTKTKDHQPPCDKVFQIQDQNVGSDDDGNPISSVVLVATTSQPTKGNGLSQGQKIALDALKTVIAKGNATDDAWKAEAYAQGITASENQDTKRKTFDRAKKYLLDQCLIEIKDGIYEIIQSS